MTLLSAKGGWRVGASAVDLSIRESWPPMTLTPYDSNGRGDILSHLRPDRALRYWRRPVLCGGGLHVPTLFTVYFVHCAINLHNKLGKPRQNCCKYFRNLLSYIDAPLAQNYKACKSLTNILFKAYTLDVCDTEKQIGCLRRKEKLSV